MAASISNAIYIHWSRDSRRYEPEFVVETKPGIYLVETKSSKDLSSEEVQAKSKAAKQYCHIATEYTTRCGGKPWSYLLVLHLEIGPAFSFKYVCELGKGN